MSTAESIVEAAIDRSRSHTETVTLRAPADEWDAYVDELAVHADDSADHEDGDTEYWGGTWDAAWDEGNVWRVRLVREEAS